MIVTTSINSYRKVVKKQQQDAETNVPDGDEPAFDP